MALSIFTNPSAMAATNSVNHSNSVLFSAMERLGTGKRINRAADNVAGLQIATRLTAQSRGMAVALRNISDATTMLQTAEGAFDEATNILYRMKDLTTQAANGTNNANDLDAMQDEFQALGAELGNIMMNTKFGGEDLFGKLAGNAVTFQIGASKGETMKVDVTSGLTTLRTELPGYATGDIKTADKANGMIETLEQSLDKVSMLRSNLGANINRLGHTKANVTNMKDNTDIAMGNIMDTNFALEISRMIRNQMLAQASMSMLKQANSMSGMVMSLLG